ncbi:hypothetical protein MRX96_021920 [Rhipicephalus microplus]
MCDTQVYDQPACPDKCAASRSSLGRRGRACPGYSSSRKAIQVAKEGAPLSPEMARQLTRRRTRVLANPGSKVCFARLLWRRRHGSRVTNHSCYNCRYCAT